MVQRLSVWASWARSAPALNGASPSWKSGSKWCQGDSLTRMLQCAVPALVSASLKSQPCTSAGDGTVTVDLSRLENLPCRKDPREWRASSITRPGHVKLWSL